MSRKTKHVLIGAVVLVLMAWWIASWVECAQMRGFGYCLWMAP